MSHNVTMKLCLKWQNLKTDSNSLTSLSENKKWPISLKKNPYEPQNPSKLCQII